MINARAAAMAAIVGLATGLAGCQMSRNEPMAMGTPTGVDGDWLSADGVAESRFHGGGFETLATDTGNKLAEGSYRYMDNQTVTVSVRSLIRQTTSSVNCSLVAPNQLNCTGSSGKQFVLRRKGVA